MDLLRDSSGIVINQKGVPLFQPGNSSDTLSMEAILVPNTADTNYTIYVQMQPTPTQVTMPVGTFNVINSNRVFTTYRISSPKGLNPRDMPNLYSKDIGLVFTTYFYASSLVTNERRLTRYNIGSRNWAFLTLSQQKENEKQSFGVLILREADFGFSIQRHIEQNHLKQYVFGSFCILNWK